MIHLRPQDLWIAFASALVPIALSAPSVAQGTVALGPESTIHSPAGSNQNDPGIAWSPDGSRVAYCWHSGQNIFARVFGADGTPQTSDMLVNDTIVSGNQDQPQVSVGTMNRTLVAWSDREGNDGELIGIFGRIYDSANNPIGPEFQINVEFQASQFRPAIAPTTTGGWVVAWTGQFDGDIFFRVINQVGGFPTGDIFVNSFDLGAQTHPDIAVFPNGRILVAFEDSTNQGGLGSGRNLWARLFQPNGAPIGLEFPVAETVTADNQRNPRIAIDPETNRFFITWEDFGNDGFGWGIYGRLFESDGTPLGPEFRINTETNGDQRRPDVDVDSNGTFLVCWDSAAFGATQVRAQRIHALGGLLGPEVMISEDAAGGYLRPEVAIEGTEALFAYDGPGAGEDAFTRRFELTCEGSVVSYCGTTPNSAGSGAVLSHLGSTSIAANDFELVATGAIPSNFGIFFYGANQISQPVGNGIKCVGGGAFGQYRLSPTLADALGSVTRSVDYTQQTIPAGIITAGSVWNFQYFYRDSVGAMVNFSDALSVTFCP